jgi:hypothetical protein
MKGCFILFFAICFYPNIILGQKLDCKHLKNGTFKLIDGGNTTIITRLGATQTEVYKGSNKPTSFKVKWLNECAYVLIPNQDVFDEYPEMPRNALLTVRIISTTIVLIRKLLLISQTLYSLPR